MSSDAQEVAEHEEARAQAGLSLEDVADIATVDDREPAPDVRVMLQLADGRTIVAAIERIEDGAYACPAAGCPRRFDSESGLNIHLGAKHPEERQRECAECGEPFTPSAGNPDQQYCDRSCAGTARRDGVILECAYCEEEFRVSQSDADNRRHCSKACRKAATHEKIKCRMCGDELETYRCNDRTFCSRDCWYAYKRRDELPDHPAALIAALREEFDNPETVYRRARAHLYPEWNLTRPVERGIHLRDLLEFTAGEIRVRLHLAEHDDYQAAMDAVRGDPEIDVDTHAAAFAALVDVARQVHDLDEYRVTPGAVARTLAESNTLYEVSRDLRVAREQTSRLLRTLGASHVVNGPDSGLSESDLLARVQDRLADAVPDGVGDEQRDEPWRRFTLSEREDVIDV